MNRIRDAKEACKAQKNLLNGLQYLYLLASSLVTSNMKTRLRTFRETLNWNDTGISWKCKELTNLI